MTGILSYKGECMSILHKCDICLHFIVDVHCCHGRSMKFEILELLTSKCNQLKFYQVELF